jgi:hypothetical protein
VARPDIGLVAKTAHSLIGAYGLMAQLVKHVYETIVLGK